MAGEGFPKAFKFTGPVGIPVFRDIEEDTDPGNVKKVFEEDVPSGKTWTLWQFLASTNVSAIIKIYADSQLLGTRRTAPGKPDADFSWLPGRPIGGGVTIKVEVETRPTPAAAAFEGHLQATQT